METSGKLRWGSKRVGDIGRAGKHRKTHKFLDWETSALEMRHQPDWETNGWLDEGDQCIGDIRRADATRFEDT